MEPLVALFRHTATPIAIVQGADNRIQLANTAWCQFWNVTAEAVEGLRLTDVLTAEQARSYDRLLRVAHAADGSAMTQEMVVMVERDGQPVQRHISATVTRLPTEQADRPCIGTLITDITDTVLARQRIDDTAREQEEQRRMMQDALDNSPIAIVITSSIRDSQTGQIIDFAYRLANREANRLSNLPPTDNLLAKTLLTAFPGDLDSGVFEQFRQVVETGEPMAVETHYQHGRIDKWFYVRVARHDDGFIQTTLDITPVKEAEAATARQADLMRTILDNAQTAISLHTAVRGTDGRVCDFKAVLANRQAIAMWGGDGKRIMEQTYRSLNPAVDTDADFARYTAVLETGQPARFDFWLHHRLYSINIARAGDGVVLSSVDITSDRQYQQQLEQINAELKRSNESLQAFAYIASHDLQEPLRKIISFSSMLTNQHNDRLDAGGQDIINRMQLAAVRMSDLIRDLLAYARIGSQSDTFRPVDLNKLMNDLLDDMDLAIQSAGATITVGPLPQLSGDSVQLRQLLQNLLSNALKFRRDDMPPVVQIRSDRAVPDQLPPALADPATASRSYWVIRITDNGIGFAPEYTDRIFQVFQRLHGRSRYTGTGIGLAIVRKVAEQHGGTVIAESQPGVGSTFSIYLPV